MSCVVFCTGVGPFGAMLCVAHDVVWCCVLVWNHLVQHCVFLLMCVVVCTGVLCVVSGSAWTGGRNW